MTFVDIDRTAFEKALTEVHFSYGANLAEGPARRLIETYLGALSQKAEGEAGLCGDCPPIGYPTDKTRCEPCPRTLPRSPQGVDGGMVEVCAELAEKVANECADVWSDADNGASWRVYVRDAGRAIRDRINGLALPREQDGAGAVANCFRHVDADDWHYLLGKLGWGGRDRFWRCVFEELRPVLSDHPTASDGFSAGQEAMREACAVAAANWTITKWAAYDMKAGIFPKQSSPGWGLADELRTLPITKPDSTEGR